MQNPTEIQLKAIRLQFDLPGNLRGMTIKLERKFDVMKWEQLQATIKGFRRFVSAS